MIWLGVLLTAAGTYAEKLGGLSVPARWLESPRVRRIAALAPVALLAALTAVLFLADGASLVVDARLAGLAFAVVALLLRAPFLLVVVGAATTTALLRAWLG
jgi:uncharacterized membrane protein